MRVFFDANVLFAAAYTNGAIRRLLDDLAVADYALVVDHYVVEEAIRNVSIQRSDAVPFLHRLIQSMDVVPQQQGSNHIPPDCPIPEKDVPVLASAIEAGCDILMTGDTRHFGSLFGESIGGVTVLSPVETARRVLDHTRRR